MRRWSRALAPCLSCSTATAMLFACLFALSVHLAISTELGATPRLTHTYQAMESRGRLRAFSRPSVSNYSTLLLSEQGDVLYVGARDAVFSLNPSNISEETHSRVDWDASSKQQECVMKGRSETMECFNFIRVLVELNETHLFVCGTYAFHPMCAYIEKENFTLVTTTQGEVLTEDGRGRSPYNPTQAYTATLADGELYSAMMKNFLGTEPVIQRSLGSRPAMKSDLLVSWLYEPRFVGSEFVQEDPEGDEDDKVYLFFTETAREFEFYSKVVVSRIARVCKGDVGGTRMLQRMWTSFQKAQLECSLPERNIHFNLIQDVFTLRTAPGQTTFYAVFTVEVGGTNVSAVCAYSMADVQQTFQGRFKEQKGPDQRWATFTGDIPEPRPGSCLRGQSSLDLPDRTVSFARDHPLVDQTVEPVGQRPLLVAANARYTQLAVQTVRSLGGADHRVMYMATDAGTLHKAIHVNGDMHLIEEMQLFSEPQSINSLLLLEKKGLLYVGSSSSVLQVPVADCGAYATCGDCVLARDPHCAWDAQSERCRDTQEAEPASTWIQDIERANASSLCPADPVEEKEVRIQAGLPLLLRCTPPSNLATEQWERDSRQLTSQEVAYTVYPRVGLLLSSPGPQSVGSYICYTLEGGFRRAMASFNVRMPPTTTTTTTTTTVPTTTVPTTTTTTTTTPVTEITPAVHKNSDLDGSGLDEMTRNNASVAPTAMAPSTTAGSGDENAARSSSSSSSSSSSVSFALPHATLGSNAARLRLSSSSAAPSVDPAAVAAAAVIFASSKGPLGAERPALPPPPVTLLPPLLSEQNQSWCGVQPVHLFCRASGPPELSVTWARDGQQLSRVDYHVDVVPSHGGSLAVATSWLRDAAPGDVTYTCSARCRGQAKSSSALVRRAGSDTDYQDAWNMEFVRWKSAARDHAKMMHLWKKALTESCLVDRDGN
ncbi:semaphorin-4A-like isoform X1 [Lampetra fluviatilis]